MSEIVCEKGFLEYWLSDVAGTFEEFYTWNSFFKKYELNYWIKLR